MNYFMGTSDGRTFSYVKQVHEDIEIKTGKCCKNGSFQVSGLGSLTLNGSIAINIDKKL